MTAGAARPEVIRSPFEASQFVQCSADAHVSSGEAVRRTAPWVVNQRCPTYVAIRGLLSVCDLIRHLWLVVCFTDIRALIFLIAIGYEQVRSIAAAIARDIAAADDVQQEPPKTDVCSSYLATAKGASCGTEAAEKAVTSSCCGPAEVDLKPELVAVATACCSKHAKVIKETQSNARVVLSGNCCCGLNAVIRPPENQRCIGAG